MGVEDRSPTAAGEMVRLVVAGRGSSRSDRGWSEETDRAGGQAAGAGESDGGVEASGGGCGQGDRIEALPWTALVEAVEGDRVKAPTASRMVRVAEAEVIGLMGAVAGVEDAGGRARLTEGCW